MIENAMIFSKENGELLVSTTINYINPSAESFTESLNKIRDIATKLEKGIFNLELEDNLHAQIFAVKKTSIAFVFEGDDKKTISQWESVAKEIAYNFDKDFEAFVDNYEKRMEFKESMQKIIEWHKKELSPVDKMKDALW